MISTTVDYNHQALISTGKFTQEQADYLSAFQLLIPSTFSLSHSSKGYYIFASFDELSHVNEAYEILIKENFKVEFTVFEDSLRIYPK